MPRAKTSKRKAVPKGAHRCGYAAIVGRPNVGKSTLLNALVGAKLSIVTPKPQTTRHRILGILTQPSSQIVFVDTPGIHAIQRRVMNQYMNRSALSSLDDADVLLFVIEALAWTEEDERVLERIRQSKRPVLAVVNKIDRVRDKALLLPYLEALSRRAQFAQIVPVSAQKGDSVERLPALIEGLLPEAPAFFPADQLTDRSERFLASEIIREKLTWRLRDELPYGLTVEIERYEREEDTDKTRVAIGAVIWVERTGQKAIVIGAGGERLKEIGRLARLELNELLFKGARKSPSQDAEKSPLGGAEKSPAQGAEKSPLGGAENNRRGSVHLELWVKVKENWADSEQALRAFGYENP